MESSFFNSIQICETETEFNILRNRQPNNPPHLSINDLPFDPRFKQLTAQSVKNTFDYIFHKFKKGIYVKIKDGKLVSFLPFDKANYTNEFWSFLKPPPGYDSLEHYLTSIYQKPQLPPHKWYANNSMFRTDNFKGQNNLEILYKWLLELCERRRINDIEFFINRRDFPLLKKGPFEPYDHIFGDFFPLLSHRYETYAPIISFSVDESFSDIMFPTFEDWARVWYQEDRITVPRHHRVYPEINTQPWDTKISKLIFRGQTTGAGFDENTNQRLRAFLIGKNHKNMMDIQFNKFAYRFRKHKSSPFIHEQKFPGKFQKAAFMDAQEQSKYKFILNLEGHVAAFRLSYELSFGSCILLTGSRWSMWFHSMLEPWVHFVPVAEDLSDLVEKMLWCLNHDDQCRQIAENAVRFYKTYLNKAAMLDFCETRLNLLAQFCGSFSHVQKPSLESYLDPWPLAAESHKKFYQVGSFEKVKQETTFFRSIENLQAVEIVLGNQLDSLKFTALQDGTLFTNIFGCLINRFPENKVASQVGYFCLNKLLHDIPNFLYTFPAPKDYFLECVCGVSFELFSNQCALEDLKSVLLQVVCTLQQGQSKVGFIHGSFTHRQLIIIPLVEPMTISYQVSSTWNIVHATKFLCLIKDFQKSRGIVYDPTQRKLITIGNLATPADKFFDLRLFYQSLTKENIHYKKIIDLLGENKSPAECIECFSKMGVEFTWWDTQMYSAMQEGNVWYRLFLFAGYNSKSALEETFEYFAKQGIYDSSVDLFSAIGYELFLHRAKWIHTQLSQSHLKYKWRTFLASRNQRKTLYKNFPTFFYPKKIYSEPINVWVQEPKPEAVSGDWITVLHLLYFAFRMNLLPSHRKELSLFHCDGYDLLRNIAAINDRES